MICGIVFENEPTSEPSAFSSLVRRERRGT